MSDSEPVAGIPLAYAQDRSQGTQQLITIKRTIFAASLFLAISGLLPELRTFGRGLRDVPTIILILTGLLSHLCLALGSFFGLLQVRAGKWLTMISLTVISLFGILGFLFRITQYGGRSFAPSGFWYYYLNYSLPSLWMLAFSVVAIIALTRRHDVLAP
jgi:hypothetical protein